jgi:hypothetical protein
MGSRIWSLFLHQFLLTMLDLVRVMPNALLLLCSHQRLESREYELSGGTYRMGGSFVILLAAGWSSIRGLEDLLILSFLQGSSSLG